MNSNSSIDIERPNRRAALRGFGGGLGTLGLVSTLAGSSDAVVARQFPPRAKRVIHLFMNGGPYQGDFFDPKPQNVKYAGQRPEAADLRTERPTAGILPATAKFRPCGESGIPISDLLPRFSRHADDLCIIRSLHTDNPNHGPALLLMNNGTITPTRPSMGSWFLYGLGTENQNLPGYVVLCPGRPVRFSVLWTSAFLPSAFQGTYINHSDLNPSQILPFLNNPQWENTEQRKQLELLQQINRRHLQEREADEALNARIQAMETAYHMQSAGREAFDINHEPEQVRAAYGEGHFANGCLMARRLVERGVRFVQVYYGNGQPWDTHGKHEETVRRLADTIDQPMAALLSDLKQRGMLDDTLVVWGGEFGRTPTSENGNGRDHNHHGFSMWLAGGGIRGGMTFGETDDFGFRAIQDKVHVHDLHATILHLMGIDHEQLTFRFAGRDYRLTDTKGRVVDRILS